MIVAGVCSVVIAITLFCLAYQSLRRRAIGNNNEEQHLLHQQTRQRYRNALKESLPFITYPVTILLWLLMYYTQIFTGNITNTAYSALDANIGTISSIVFFTHIKIIGRRRRNLFRNRSRITEPSNTIQEINEGERITIAGSVTATHVTHFDPLGDSDVEP